MMDIKTLLEDEIDILYTTLDRLKIYDIRLPTQKMGGYLQKTQTVNGREKISINFS